MPLLDSSPEAEVQAALDGLKSANLAIETSGGRVSRYSHNLERVLQVPSQSAAILTVLMLSDISAVQGLLDELAARSLVVQLPRLPGAQENRWAHLSSGSPKTEMPADKTRGETPDLKAAVERLDRELAELKALVERISKATGAS